MARKGVKQPCLKDQVCQCNHPHVGLNRVWERLEKCYGSPEAIEGALYSNTENFAKISSKDYRRLRDLGDLLIELESAKQDGYLPGLRYLDTSKGVSLILDKLPFNLQENWRTQGTRYKRTQGRLSPFLFLCRLRPQRSR